MNRKAAGSLELILGCMFSGKSTELIRRIRMRKVLQQNILVVTHACDTRYGNDTGTGNSSGYVISHDAMSEKGIPLEHLSHLFDSERALLTPDIEVVCIEEGQFFSDLWRTVVRLIETPYHKHVIVSALDGDYQRKPFRQVVDLIPMAEQVVKLQALCMYCKDGTPACFSMRLPNAIPKDPSSVVYIGGKEAYASVCRHHYTTLGRP